MKTKCVIDIETGGFSIENNGICEIGLVIIDEKNEIIDEFAAIIKPYNKEHENVQMTYNPHAEKVHGITIEHMNEFGLEPQYVADTIDLLLLKYGCTEFIGHNIVKFDAPRLNEFFRRFGIRINTTFDNCIDTMELAREQLDLASNSLESLCEFYGVNNEDEHRALPDVYATLEVYTNLIKEPC